MIFDNYNPCHCASGKKYKFCCKRMSREIAEAMIAAENGKMSEALNWITQAKAIVGETAELLCNEAIVYSFFDPEKYKATLDKCLAINPNHPRAHYLRGISFKEQGDLQNAMTAYETAIANYPTTDNFHLNEVYNSIGALYYDMEQPDEAKAAWEKALAYLPNDHTAQHNLAEYIYGEPHNCGGH